MKGRCRSSPCGARRLKTRASMRNHHGGGLVKQVSDTLHTWRERVRQRRELAQWTDRDLHDVGLSWSDIALEVKKPFWRA